MQEACWELDLAGECYTPLQTGTEHQRRLLMQLRVEWQ